VALGSTGHLPDTFLNLTAWGKGVAFVNGFNLGWYWPSLGPQRHYYVPGPLLRRGSNEVLLVEVEALPDERQGTFLSFEAQLSGQIGFPMLHLKEVIFYATGHIICLLYRLLNRFRASRSPLREWRIWKFKRFSMMQHGVCMGWRNEC
jgi:hypothetical protein